MFDFLLRTPKHLESRRRHVLPFPICTGLLSNGVFLGSEWPHLPLEGTRSTASEDYSLSRRHSGLA